MPRADRSTGASAIYSLSSGPSYTESALPDGQGAKGASRNDSASPVPLTEFQRFVAATTGQLVPVYGANLFAAQPASFGPVDNAPVPPDLVVSANDELRIRIWGQVNFSANLRVSREGEIFLPKVGAVHVAGLPFSAIAPHLRSALDQVYRNYELSVDLGQIHSIQIYVTGRARHPGEYTVSALSTLVDAIFSSGGPAPAGSMRHMELKRAGRVITDFDLYALLVNGDKTGDVQLQAGDVLYIPPTGPQVALLGSVRQAAIFELRGSETISQLLDAAGGLTALASATRMSVERVENHTRRRAFEIAADPAGLATALMDGDIVRIEPIVSNYRDTVTLRGSVANPGRFRWHAGMHLSELMPDRDSLVARDYWWRRTQLGLPAPEFAPSIDALAPQPAADQSPQPIQRALLGTASSEAVAHSLPSAPGSQFDAGFMASKDAKAGSGAGNRTQGPVSVLRPGAETDWSYAVIERLDPATMTTSLIPFDLGKLVLDHDVSQDLELHPGDVVTVFSQDDIHMPIDQQTKYVRLEGEFVHAGVYSVAPGETLRSLVARAGGLTGKAYLYAATFTRKSTRQIEQQRFNEYIDRLEGQLERSSISLAATGGAGGVGPVQQSQVESTDQRLIARLRRLQATGRVVLQMQPRSAGTNDLPDLPLEDGDELVVPSVPATIQVVGAVLNQNAFLYRDKARVSHYLHLAGGPSGNADRRKAFILRADGSVTSHDAGQPIFANSFDNVRLYPGDTIIVPEKMVHRGAMQAFLSWAQLFSQLALGAAAVNVIK